MRKCSKCHKEGHYRPSCKKGKKKLPKRSRDKRRTLTRHAKSSGIEVVPIAKWLKEAKSPAKRYQYCIYSRIYDGEDLYCGEPSTKAVIKREGDKTYVVGVCSRHVAYGKKVIK